MQTTVFNNKSLLFLPHDHGPEIVSLPVQVLLVHHGLPLEAGQELVLAVAVGATGVGPAGEGGLGGVGQGGLATGAQKAALGRQ